MDMRFWLLQVFNGVSYGALLFLLGSGLSLIFGVMRIVNLAHGSFFLLGAYIALSVIWATGLWLLAIPAAALAIACIGMAIERIFMRPLGGDHSAAGIAHLWFRAAVPAGGARYLGGRQSVHQSAEGADAQHRARQRLPSILSGLHHPDGRRDRPLAVAGAGADASRRDRARNGRRRRDGARHRHRHLARVNGDVRPRRPAGRVGGVIGGGFLGVYPGLDFDVLPLAFAVVIIGGMGSLAGAAIGAVIVGLLDNFGKVL
jgi:branched-chain amino acid transport system permease protein